MNDAEMTSPAISCRHICDIDIWQTAIDTDSTRDTRRARECRAVALLIRAAFGDTAQLEHHPSGAPFIIITSGNTSKVVTSISISHCSDTAMLAVAREGTAIGIDCELPRRALRNVAPRILSEEELSAWSASDNLLLQAWTIKEAVYKAAAIQGLPFAEGIRLPAPTTYSDKNEINSEYVATITGGRRFQLITISELPMTTIAIAVDTLG
jgi:phosphopantetheinyl transferase (holo-ACP synthase)